MSITSLIVGTLIADPEQRTGATGKAFVTFRMAAGTDDESALVSGIAYGTAADQIASQISDGRVAAFPGQAGRLDPSYRNRKSFTALEPTGCRWRFDAATSRCGTSPSAHLGLMPTTRKAMQ